jgi:AraC-like DNA-binding protein
VGRRASVQVDQDWLARRYLMDLASTQEIAAELGCSTYLVTQALIRYGIPRRPVGTPKGLPARQVQVARLQQIPTRQLHQILVEADTEVEAATTLGVSRVVLRQVAADAGIDQETVIRQRATRQRTAAWPALLRDRDRLAEALDASPSVSAVARRAGCSRETVRAAAAYHQIPKCGPAEHPAGPGLDRTAPRATGPTGRRRHRTSGDHPHTTPRRQRQPHPHRGGPDRGRRPTGPAE